MLERPLFEFITGRAGTGKSFLLKELADNSSGKYALCSTTGISAVNLGFGVTINSLLWYFDHASLLTAWTTGKLTWRLEQLYNKMGIRRILLDEASMCSGKDLSVLCFALDELNGTLVKNGKEQLGLTICGDMAQLPPVDGGFPFESECWSRFEENTTLLTHVYRQKDPDFLAALEHVRKGTGAPAAEYLHDRMNRLADPSFNGTTLYPYNSSVDRQNQYALEKITGETVKFKSKKDGRQRPEWKYIPDELVLKLNSLVMILANQYGSTTDKIMFKRISYSNGDLGVVTGATTDSVSVELYRGGKAVVGYITRDNEEIVGDKKTKVGSIEYLPVRLAWASSVHKSQSLTLSSVQIDIRPKFYQECPGMLYTALSRCRTKEGLRIIGSPKTFIQNCRVNPKVEKFL